jgi:hypothetical protein
MNVGAPVMGLSTGDEAIVVGVDTNVFNDMLVLWFLAKNS